jgi:hypothetical protein
VTATEAARDKQQKIKDRFAEWIWEDDARRARLVEFYNREFNHLRLRTFNGDHLTLPGASPTIALRPHQKAAVWRILQTPNALLAHVVGAGKTYTMAAAAMELKRLGLARKPMFVVPNHMLGQFSSELLTLYPGANILAAGRDDFASLRRRELMSRIATNNWDAIIVTHSGFERLPLSAEARKDFLDGQLTELTECIHEHKSRIGASSSGTRIVKELERAKKKLEARIKALGAEHRKDDTLTFEELGVDRLFVDEAQAFKNLFYISKMTRVAGLPQTASERAFDMFLKVQHVQKQNGGAGVVFATGTPVTNTMAEMFTMQRYLQMDVLRQQKLQHFDAWAGTFGETVTAMELSPDGAGYPAKHEAIVSQEIWDRANAATAETKTRPVHLFQERDAQNHLLKGLAWCGSCGRALVPNDSGKKSVRGVKYRYYTCSLFRRESAIRPCAVGRLSADALERVVIALIGEASKHPTLIGEMVEVSRRTRVGDRDALRREVDRIKESLTVVDKKLRNCAEAVANDGADALREALIRRAADLRDERQRLLVEQERARQALVASEAGALEERRIRDNLERLGQVLPNLPPEERKELIRLFVERVDVRGAKPNTRRKPQEEPAIASATAARVMEINIKLHLAELVRGMEERAAAQSESAANRRAISIRGLPSSS